MQFDSIYGFMDVHGRLSYQMLTDNKSMNTPQIGEAVHKLTLALEHLEKGQSDDNKTNTLSKEQMCKHLGSVYSCMKKVQDACGPLSDHEKYV